MLSRERDNDSATEVNLFLARDDQLKFEGPSSGRSKNKGRDYVSALSRDSNDNSSKHSFEVLREVLVELKGHLFYEAEQAYVYVFPICGSQRPMRDSRTAGVSAELRRLEIAGWAASIAKIYGWNEWCNTNKAGESIVGEATVTYTCSPAPKKFKARITRVYMLQYSDTKIGSEIVSS
ncbi:hypothetical protein FIBSPDRAFT_932715 [Athelia psychrophila]|uniref:Uncharacterized protein n=1 Tax=Athelia psychrophila TaxID=1759441 RepID=A0A166I9M0_9AGAM|nr:hypothetical protein FIBSPDRAFT_932715 [Fibularhizoctonia sp. CBS 109695]